MNIDKPVQVALIIAFVVGLLCGLALTGIMALNPAISPTWHWMALPPLMFAIAFFTSLWAIEYFLNRKIKTIYRSMQGPDQLEAKVKAAMKSGNTMETVQHDVKDWASVKQSEIKSLKEQARFRRDFIGNLAHELKTPIFNMQGYLMTLIEGGLEDPKINYEYLDRADKNLERLITLVEDLDGISKLEDGRETLKQEKFNLVKLCEGVFALFDLRANERNITLRFDKKYDKPLLVKADKSKIQQVLSNLVINAINYGNDDGFCEVRFFDMAEKVMVEVADNGPGIEAEHLPRLFERFYRIDKSRSRHEGGTGLGLAICKHIIESHGQTINVRSVVGKGTTFTFTLQKAK